MRRAALITTLTGLLVLASTWLAIATTRGWPAALPRHLGWYVAAGVAWLVALATVRVTTRAQRWIVVAVAVALRVPAWLAVPAHSDDVYRYRWDGRLQRAGTNPYRHAPDAPELAALRDADWEHINHRSLPTIYPPLAEIAFATAPSLVAWKILVALADAAVALILYMGAPGEWRWLAWAWSPLVVIEIGLDGHVDALGIALLVGALWAWTQRREGAAGGLVGAAAMIKLLPVVALVGMRSRRAALAAGIVAGAIALPYISAGPQMTGSLGEYSRRWRANDGAFALVHAGAERLASRPVDLGRWPWLAHLVTGRERDQVYPDETANFLARGLMGLAFLGLLGWATWRRWSTVRVVEAALGGFVLLTPALHPWYVLWLVPMFVLGGSWAWLVLAALVPLGYRPLDEWHTRGTWHDPVWTRAVEHGAAWTALAIDRWWTSGIILKLGESSPRRW